jgi:TrmH family RNA methyltransferase
MNLASVEVVLVRPARAANVAAACRAMKNMGLSQLRLVEAACDLTAPEARNLAYGAWDVLDSASRHDDLLGAVRESTLVVGTSGRVEAGDWTARALSARAAEWAAGGRISLVFGPEASGLRTDELRLCHRRVRVPTDPLHPSLNLAQAVLLLAYELRLAAALPAAAEARPDTASAGAVEEALQELREGLLGIGYLREQNPDKVLAELRQLVVRARPSVREVTLLRGVARQLRFAGTAIARRSGPSG